MHGMCHAAIVNVSCKVPLVPSLLVSLVSMEKNIITYIARRKLISAAKPLEPFAVSEVMSMSYQPAEISLAPRQLKVNVVDWDKVSFQVCIECTAANTFAGFHLRSCVGGKGSLCHFTRTCPDSVPKKGACCVYPADGNDQSGHSRGLCRVTNLTGPCRWVELQVAPRLIL